MNGKQKKRMAVDVLMTAALLLLMPYGMVEETAHEWIGAGMLVLFILHHVLNRKWLGGMRKGKYTPVRILQTVLAAAVLVCMIGSMFLSSAPRPYVSGAAPAHGLRLLGICADVSASGYSLGNGHKAPGKKAWQPFRRADPGFQTGRRRCCRLWGLGLLEEKYRQLYVSEGSFRVF